LGDALKACGKYVENRVTLIAGDLQTRADDNILTESQARTCTPRRKLNG
jgi:hypothetical protein